MNKILNKVIGFITTHSIEVSSFQPRFHAIPMRTSIVLRGERFRILRGAFAQKVLRRPSPLPKPNSSSVLEEQLRQRDYPHWTAWYPFTFYYSAIFPLCRKVLIETDRNPNFHYLPKPNILHFQKAEYSAETEYSAEYLIFC